MGLSALRLDDDDELYDGRRRALARPMPPPNATMLTAEYLGNLFDVATHDAAKNATANATEPAFIPELFYRHSMAMTAVYCVAYLLVFAVGIVGNFFVIAVVFRSPRMRTVTNFFIVNLAVADILVIVFCLPATLMSNIFVRK